MILTRFLKLGLKSSATYRSSLWTALFADFIFLYATKSLWTGLGKISRHASTLSASDLTTYSVLACLLYPILNYEGAQSHITNHVQGGTLEQELYKPVNFIWLLFCRDLGGIIPRLFVRTFPSLLLCILFLDFKLPPSMDSALWFLASLALGYLISFLLSCLLGMVSIVAINIRSYSWIYNTFSQLASGARIPYSFLPAGLARFFAFLPFSKIYYCPISIYLGSSNDASTTLILTQIAWIGGLLWVTCVAWSRMHRHITSQGG